MERRRVIYRGRVQGVGFRWRTVRALEPLGVTGFVRNLRDGSVELVVEGAVPATQAALDAVRATLARQIESAEVSIAPATGEFPDFRVVR